MGETTPRTFCSASSLNLFVSEGNRCRARTSLRRFATLKRGWSQMELDRLRLLGRRTQEDQSCVPAFCTSCSNADQGTNCLRLAPEGDLSPGGKLRSSSGVSGCVPWPSEFAFPCQGFHPNPFPPLAPSPSATALYTSPHIPAANAFSYRSLPSSPPATVSERSIRNASLPLVPVVWSGKGRGFDRRHLTVYPDLIYVVRVAGLRYWRI